jgi:hypothetical protein
VRLSAIGASRRLRLVALGAVALAALSGLGMVGAGGEGHQFRREHYRSMALQAQQHTWRVLAYPGGASDCEAAPYLTYRRDTANVAISDHWYVALQLRADAALLHLGEDAFRCHVDKTVAWMERLWDPAHAGFAPRADLDGTNPTLQDVYADDNALIGLAFVDAARATADPSVRARALDAAERAAGYLMRSGLWDDALGGGLWWTNQRETAGEGKPAQTTALMAHLMAELHAETGRAFYRDWALSGLRWLDDTLWVAEWGLYAYSINRSPDDPEGVAITDRYYGYDQAIAIQALLRLHRSQVGTDYLGQAQRLGRAMDRAFWHDELGGYRLEAHLSDLYAPYAAWVSEALLDLYAADGDPFWRDRARANLDALHRTFHGEGGGYYRLAFPCVGERVGLCRPGEQWGLERIVYGMTQALMQRAAALQAAAY